MDCRREDRAAAEDCVLKNAVKPWGLLVPEFGVGDGGGEDGEGESEGVVDLRGVGRAVGDQVWG